MAFEVTMPKLSDTMTEGVFSRWLKSPGDRVERGDIIAEIETDKAVMELEAFNAGILVKTMVHGGELVPVGAVLGLIAAADEQVIPDTSQPVQLVQATKPPPPPVQPEPPVMPAIHEELSDNWKASPYVRRLAREQGLDLAQLHGSGPEGRITEADLTAAISKQPPPRQPEAEPAKADVHPSPATGTSTTMRQAIATTVSRSWQEIPHFSATVEIAMQACQQLIEKSKAGPVPVGYTALLLKACADTLKNFPLFHPVATPQVDSLDINLAVALPNGLMMPLVKNCQSLRVTEIEQEVTRLTEKCRTGRLTADELSSGVFALSNLGMFGVDQFQALIVPGQKAILAVGAVRERPVVQQGQVIVAPLMSVTLSADHRSIDGAYAASFLAALRSLLESPATIQL